MRGKSSALEFFELPPRVKRLRCTVSTSGAARKASRRVAGWSFPMHFGCAHLYRLFLRSVSVASAALKQASSVACFPTTTCCSGHGTCAAALTVWQFKQVVSQPMLP